MPASTSGFAKRARLGLICCPQLTAVAPDDPRVPMFQQQALAALSGEEANISDRFQTRCCIWFED
jgi:hypothetical protein